MYNMTIRKWIEKVEIGVETLKKDYETFEETETEEMRQEVLKDIKEIRTDIGIVNQKIKDLRCF